MTRLRYASVCSGIEAASVAWAPLGWCPMWFSEVAAFPKAVLAHHYPNVPDLGDMSGIIDRLKKGDPLFNIDVLVGGTPCQSFSIAGKRDSLNDERGNLTMCFVRLVHATDPRWTVWENVPGVLSTDDNAFGCFLAGLVGEDTALISPGGRWTDAGMVAGPERTAAWRILDAQHFGLAQRRRRVFVVSGRTCDRSNPGAVLFESDSLRRHSAPSRPPRPVTAAVSATGVGVYGPDDNQEQTNHLIAFGGNNTKGPIEIAAALTAQGGRMDFESETFVTSYRTTGYGTVYEEGDRVATLTTNTDRCANVLAVGVVLRGREGGATIECGDDLAHALRSSQGGSDKPFAMVNDGSSLHVRRLLPVECERLQGFPDGYTDIPWRGRPGSPDGSRYKALGNSMAVPVMHWIGQRIEAVEAAQAGNVAAA